MPDALGGAGGAQADVSFFVAASFFSPLFLLLEEEERERTREEGKQKRPFSRNKKNKFQPLIPPPPPSPSSFNLLFSPPPPKKKNRYVPYPHKANRLAGERLRQSLEPLVDAAGIDLVLSGHVHSFARSCNAAGLRCGPRARGGAVHYTLGCGGRKLSGVEGVEGQPAWIAAAEDMWGFLRIDADGERGSLTASFVRAGDGSVGDSVVLYAAERPPSHACRGWGGRGRGARRGEGAGGNASVKIEASIE